MRDYRVQQLHKLSNVEYYFESELDAGFVLDFGIPRIAVATGSRWRRDGVGHQWTTPIPAAPGARVTTPDDFMDGRLPEGESVVIWDDDHYYMAGVLAEAFCKLGWSVDYVTPATEVSAWTRNTMEQYEIQRHLLNLGVRIHLSRNLVGIKEDHVVLACMFTGSETRLDADVATLVTSRSPVNDLYIELNARRSDWPDAGVERVTVFGDAEAPATIAHAVYAGRRYAEELDAPPVGDAVPFKREIAELAPLG